MDNGGKTMRSQLTSASFMIFFIPPPAGHAWSNIFSQCRSAVLQFPKQRKDN